MTNLKDYKKSIILSFCILLLLLIIILPPLTRASFPKKEIDPEDLLTTTYLICTKTTKDYKVVSKTEYHDYDPYQNTITYNKLNENDTSSSDIVEEIKNLRSVLGVIYRFNEKENSTTIIIDKAVRDDNTSNTSFTNYLQDKSSQQLFYEEKGYSCKSSS